jgi:TolA-binding protein
MRNKKIGISLLAFFITFFVFSQKTKINNTPLTAYNHAVHLYENKSYKAAQELFINLKNNFSETSELKANCEFYIADCAIKLNQPKSDNLMQQFVINYPTSLKQNNAFIKVANYYFKIGKYSYAAKWFSKVNPKNINKYHQDEFNFKYAYSLFVNKNYKKSKELFFNLFTSLEYGAKAKYYYGYIAYKQDDYSTAQKYLSSVETNSNFKTKVSYYLADMNFKLGKFQKAIDHGLPLLEKAKGLEYSEISKIIGESYFNLHLFKEAIPYLKNYKGKRGKWINTDYYLLGYAYFKQNDYENALNNFNKIISGNNAVSQNAYYHLGECYLKLNKKSEALNAFRNAANLPFNEIIKKDAWYNYAKISYEIGNPYKSVPSVLQEFLKNYPKSEHSYEIHNLLMSAFLTSKNYQGAINYLNSSKNKADKIVLQQVYYYRGVELFNLHNYKEAIINFDNSLKYKNDESITAKATFWIGESYYQLNNFTNAIIYFTSFINNTGATKTEEYKTIHYNLGYTYFKLKDYNNAIREFKRFASDKLETSFKNDTYLRIADSYFVSKKYTNAITYYQKSIHTGIKNIDYAQFQIALSNGFLGNESKKIEILKALLNQTSKSIYKDDALYILGNAYIKKNNTEKAITTFNTLIRTYKRSPLVPKALLKKGLIYYNTNQNDKALETYKYIVKTYSKSSEARQAVTNAKQIYIDLGKVDDYANWVKTIDFASVTNAELDDAMYDAAERQYLNNNTKKAIVHFKKYLQNFSNGLHSLPANFYLGQLLNANQQTKEAIANYSYVINEPENEFTEKSLVQLSIIYLKNKNWTKVAPLLIQLENISNDFNTLIFAKSNLMKVYYHQKNYEKSVNYAENLLKDNNLAKETVADAQLIIARSAIKTNQLEKAKNAYKKVAKIASGALKAEALYYNAYFKNEEGSYLQSNEIIKNIAANYTAYKLWAAKSLLIMADNYYHLNDGFQATYILESVIKNFSEFEEVTTQAKNNLQEIKTEQAKTNESVNTNKN